MNPDRTNEAELALSRHFIQQRKTSAYAPGLSDAAARREGRLGIEHFADGADASFPQAVGWTLSQASMNGQTLRLRS
jgi:hypothetical protein